MINKPQWMNIGALACSAILIAGCGNAPEQTGQVQAVDTSALAHVQASMTQVDREIELDGIVEAVNRATVSAQTSGQIESLPFDVGDVVPAGSVIARITDTQQQAGVNAARAQLQEAKARFNEANQQLKRIEEVFAKGAVSQAEFDQVKAAQQSAAARVDSAQAALNDAVQRLDYTTVVAPYSGIVVRRLVDVGATVAPGTPLLEGIALDNLRVRVNVPQQYIAPLRSHRQARVVTDAGQSIAAAQLRIPPSADVQSQSFAVLAELPAEQEAGLLPGTLVKVAFAIGSGEQIILPDSAIARRGEITGVYVDEKGVLSFRYVRTGTTLGDGNTVILAGLSDGQQVISDPVAAANVYKQQRVAISQ